MGVIAGGIAGSIAAGIASKSGASPAESVMVGGIITTAVGGVGFGLGMVAEHFPSPR